MTIGSIDTIATSPTHDRRLVEGRSLRWSAYLANEAAQTGAWANTTLSDALAETARHSPERILIVDGEVELTAQKLATDADRLARVMTARMPRSSVVSFMLPNWHEAAIIYLACNLAGMVAHPILPSLRDRELRFMLADVESRMILLPDQWRGHDYAAMIERIVPDLERPPEAVIVRGSTNGRHLNFNDLVTTKLRAPLPTLNPSAVQMILYTSGTTGRPKGVMHTHNSLHALTRQIGEQWRVASGDAFLVPSPISHIGGSLYAFEAPVLLGTTAVLMDRWDPEEAIRIASRRRCTHMAGATPFLDQMLTAARAIGERLPNLKVFICGGASVPPYLIRQASEWFDHTAVTRVYGSTEVPVTTVGAPKRDELALAANTDGRPGFAEVRISLDGEVLARGPQMMAGYLHAEDEEGAFDDQGFYRTGDLGCFTPEGCLMITGRAKDLIIRKGENIAPKEVEDALVEHPNILEASVVGLPDQVSGEKACAVLVTAHGESPDMTEIVAFLRNLGLATFKIPETLTIWPSLPKNDAGKVLKHEIRARLLAAKAED